MKSFFSLFPLFLFFLLTSCVVTDDDEATPMPEPEPEPRTLSTGLVFNAPFNGNADDVSTTGLTGTVTGATITMDRTGAANGAYRFDGVDDYINFGNETSLAFSGRQAYTIASWVKPEQRSDDSRMHIISKFDGGVRATWYLGVGKDGTVDSYRNVAPWATFGVGTFPWNEYVHVATTYDGTDLVVYINGVEDNRTPFGGNPNDNVTDIIVGGVHSRGAVVPNFKGIVDEVRIYNRVLTQEELTWLANN
ncbi:MAG: LamG domain-containing protein [Bacteroidota bacterium]